MFPPKSFSSSTFLSTLRLLAIVLMIPLQACSVVESFPSADPSLTLVLNGETIKQDTETTLQTDDNDSKFAVAASSYMKKVNPKLSDNEARLYASYIQHSSEEHRLNKVLYLALIKVESRFDARAISSDGSKGLTQIRERYHRQRIAKAIKRFDGGNVFTPRVNLEVGAQIFQNCVESTKTSKYAIACYNGSKRPNAHTKLVFSEYLKLLRYM